MRGRFHPGTFLAGLVYTLLGAALTLETVGVWTLEIRHLAYLGPLLLVVAGLGVLLAAVWRHETANR